MKAGDRFNPYGHFYGLWVPDWLAERVELSPGAKLLYSSLARHAGKDGECFPGQTRLGRLLGLQGTTESQERTIRKFTKELIDAVLVESIQRGLGMTNLYFFLWHPWMEGKVRTDCDTQGKNPAGDPVDPSGTSIPGGVSAQEPSKASAPERTPESGQEPSKASAPERAPVSGKENQLEEIQFQEIQGEEIKTKPTNTPHQTPEPSALGFGGDHGGDPAWQDLTLEEQQRKHLDAALWDRARVGKPVSNMDGFEVTLRARWEAAGDFSQRDFKILREFEKSKKKIHASPDGHTHKVDYLMGQTKNTMTMAEGVRLMRKRRAELAAGGGS